LTLAATTGEAPWPALVTVGHDDEDAAFMLDLEQAGTLNIHADEETAHAILAALAIELATSPWADDLQVTLVGTHADLPGLVSTNRIRHVPALTGVLRQLAARAENVHSALAQVGAVSIPDARGRGLAVDSWTPEIVLISEQLEPSVRAELDRVATQVPGVGIAAVTTGAEEGQWALDMGATTLGRGVLHPANVAIRPQLLDETTYAQAVALLASPQPAPGPAWAVGLDDTEIRLNDLAALPGFLAWGQGDAAIPDDDTMDMDLVAGPGRTPEDAAQPPDQGPGPAADLVAGGGVAPVALLHPPVVRVLGPVTVDVASGSQISSAYQAQATELIAFLAFTPGASSAAVSHALWPVRAPNENTRDSAMSRARRWLGCDGEGNDHLMRYSGGAGAPAAGKGGYRLHGVSTDWEMFLALVGSDVTVAPTSVLLEALALVRGRPFADVPPRRYGWADEARPGEVTSLVQEITAAVVDVAHEVAGRALATGDLATARLASTVGRTVDPVDERVWRDAIKTEWAAKRTGTVERLIRQLMDLVEEIDMELEPETQDLIRDIDDRARRHLTAKGA
jgi:hypothetical protein